MRALLITALLVSSIGATYYVRPNGGTYGTSGTGVCNGQTNVDFSGANGPNCAINHPFWVTGTDPNCGNRATVMVGGDTLIIKQKVGGYLMGLTAPGSAGSPSFPWDCHMNPLPSGPDAAHKTKVYGENVGNCSARTSATELFASEDADWIIDMRSSNNIDLQCLELTDHSSCRFKSAYNTGGCSETYPRGDYGEDGIKAWFSTNVNIKDVWVHGMASEGISTGNLSSWVTDNLNIWANTSINWNMNGRTGNPDLSDANTGSIVIKNGSVMWAGCQEKYPFDGSVVLCGSQSQGTASDGIGASHNGAQYTVSGMTFMNNVADGLDLLYVEESGGSVTAYNNYFDGNSGNALKMSNNILAYNNILVANCDFFVGKSYTATAAQALNGFSFSDHCRADGTPISMTMQTGTTIRLRGNTIVNVRGANANEITGRGTIAQGGVYNCTSGNTVSIKNSVYSSTGCYSGVCSGTAAWVGVDSSCTSSTITQDHDVIFGLSSNPSGTGNVYTDPLLSGPITNLLGTITTGSASVYPTISSPLIGIADITASGQPSTDYNIFDRGSVWDAGALENGSSPTGGGPPPPSGVGFTKIYTGSMRVTGVTQ